MNRSRIIVLALAALAAGAAALLARSMLGGGTPPSKAEVNPSVTMAGVLVAARNIDPGTALKPDMVRWQDWPKSSLDSSFLTRDSNPSSDEVVKGTVARAPIIAGEPLTNNKFVHADSTGVMAAMVSPGMRAVSIPISTESGAGGFILPNDRVDVIATIEISDQPKLYVARTLLHAVRVLAVDQTYTQDKDQKTVLAKTATLELSPQQSETVEAASATGTIALALRPLGDNGTADVGKNKHKADTGVVAVIRYGLLRGGGPQKPE